MQRHDILVGIMRATASAIQNSGALMADEVPITIAVVDPEEAIVGLTIQDDYPLTDIDRSHGLPQSRLLNDCATVTWEPTRLHMAKLALATHEQLFLKSAENQLFVSAKDKTPRVAISLSVGMGNLLINRDIVGFYRGRTFRIHDQTLGREFPCLCAIEETPGAPLRLGVENIKFEADETVAKPGLRWAISGYPLRIDGENVDQAETLRFVSDYRHAWRLPILHNSIGQYLVDGLKLEDDIKPEFYFGFDELCTDEVRRGQAIRGAPVDFELNREVPAEWMDRTSALFDTNPDELIAKCKIFKRKSDAYWLSLKTPDVRKDFDHKFARYSLAKGALKKGAYSIKSGTLTVKLADAIYPHHIVGTFLDEDTKKTYLVNISIGGSSGRTGVSIPEARQLCENAGLHGAIIFDNGFDVVARVWGSPAMAHPKNNRDARFTCALHVGQEHDQNLVPSYGKVSIFTESHMFSGATDSLSR